MVVFLINHVWILYAAGCSLLWGIIVFGWHTHKESKQTKKDSIVLTARLDGQFKKIDSQFEAVAEGIEATQKTFSDQTEWLYKQINKPNP